MTSTDPVSASRWVLAWGVLVILLILIARWRVGYVVLYYLALLVLIFIVLTQYQAISGLLSPFNTLPGAKKS